MLIVAPAGDWRAASADPNASAAVAEYREAVTQGTELFARGAFSAARTQFERAYAIHPDPLLVFNIASTYRRQEQHEQAIEHYRRFLALVASDDPRAVLARETIDHLEEMRRRAEGGAAAAGPDTAPHARTPGAGASTSALPPSTAGPGKSHLWSPPPDTDEGGGRALRVIGLGATAVGLVGLGLATADGRRALRAERQIEALPPGTAWEEDHASLYRRGQAAEQRAVAFAVAGSALIATGVVLYIAGARDERPSAGVTSITVAPVGRGGGLVLGGGF
jgi:tetratricopeptide (TPR) repeat protein